jgi:2-C-methyl-D-erythritol 4-phosphate cytidylyltransferase
MNVTAAVVAGPHGVDVLAPVCGAPMAAHAVRALLAAGLVDHVLLLGPAGRVGALVRACAGLPVSAASGAHIVQRAGGTVGDDQITQRVEVCSGGLDAADDVVLLHDAARPLAPPALAVAVVEAVRAGHAMAVPVLPLPDTVKRVDDERIVRATPDRAGLRVLQTPVAVRAGLLAGVDVRDPLEPVRRVLADGGTVHPVPGHPAAFAVRCEWDLELAELLAGRTIEL